MGTREAIAQRIEELCKTRGITINALSYRAGVSNSTIRDIFYKRSLNPGIVTIKKLCDGLDITLAQFFNTDTFKKLEQELK